MAVNHRDSQPLTIQDLVQPIIVGQGQPAGVARCHAAGGVFESECNEIMSILRYIPFNFLCINFILLHTFLNSGYCLFPRESRTREIKKLDGIWNFRICSQDDQDIGFRENWYKYPLAATGEVIPMPVPSSFNDITQNKTIRDYLGWSWYDTSFFIPQRWRADFRVVLQFGSAHYMTCVFLNGIPITNHTGGHLPFEGDVTKYLNFAAENILTVALNNTLSQETIPQGSKTFKPKPYPSGFYAQSTNFDFFNYAGIHRSVVLYAMPVTYIDDIKILTDINGTTGCINYNVSVGHHTSVIPDESLQNCVINVFDKAGKIVANQKGCSGEIMIHNASLWWPFTMHHSPAYLYTLQVQLTSKDVIDEYFQKVGIRTVQLKENKFLINGKPFYFMGFGKHEDTNIRGKGLDIPLIVKDFNLIKWIGANSFRTSHYPYSEEMMDQADEQGIVVIDECPAVALQSFNSILLNQHLQIIKELISRDKNRPSVIAWSVANEPRSSQKEADEYFKNVVSYTKQLDPSRPVTAALNADLETEKIGKYMDFIMLNHYFAWYSDIGSTETILPLMINLFNTAYQKYQKAIMMSEYGADTLTGLHMDPPFAFTEDYQNELIIQHHKAFDILYQKGFFIGEHIWNFADFLTLQEINRVVGNKKGIFTRERQPKAAAKILRYRYHKLVNSTLHDKTAYC